MTDFLWKMPVNPLVGGGSGSGTGTTYTPPTVTGSIDHVAAALDRLPQQFKGKPNIEALITALVSPANVLEDALQQMLLRFSIDNGEGVQLDNIGNIVGQPRNGLTDASYKRYLRARILTNRSDGKPGTLRKIARLILGTSDGQVITQRMNIATCQMLIQGLQVDAGTARALITFLSHAPGAGVRFLLETLVYPEDETFTMAMTAVTSGALTAGTSTIILVNSTSGFPTSGSLILNPGGTPTESVTYSTTFIHSSGSPAFRLTAAPTNSYSSGIVVALATVTGESWGNGRWARGSEVPLPRAYPTSVEGVNAAIGYGTWDAGWLCDDTSGNLVAAFGSPDLTPGTGATYGLQGALSETDKAVSGEFDGGDVFDASADIIIAAVVNMSSSGIVMAKGVSSTRWTLSVSGGQVTFLNFDGTHTTQATTPSALGDEWATVIAVLDRAGNKIRVGMTGLTSGVTSVSALTDASATGAWNSVATFQLGPASVSAAYIGADSLIATDLSINLETALANFVASLS